MSTVLLFKFDNTESPKTMNVSNFNPKFGPLPATPVELPVCRWRGRHSALSKFQPEPVTPKHALVLFLHRLFRAPFVLEG